MVAPLLPLNTCPAVVFSFPKSKSNGLFWNDGCSVADSEILRPALPLLRMGTGGMFVRTGRFLAPPPNGLSDGMRHFSRSNGRRKRKEGIGASFCSDLKKEEGNKAACSCLSRAPSFQLKVLAPPHSQFAYRQLATKKEELSENPFHGPKSDLLFSPQPLSPSSISSLMVLCHSNCKV